MFMPVIRSVVSLFRSFIFPRKMHLNHINADIYDCGIANKQLSAINRLIQTEKKYSKHNKSDRQIYICVDYYQCNNNN